MLYIIVNPASKSGLGRKRFALLKNEFNKNHIVYEVFFTEKKYGAGKCIKTILERIDRDKTKNPVIAVLGGDGTINETVNALYPRTDVTIAYLPTGSSNDLARALKVSPDPVEFVKRYRIWMDKNKNKNENDIKNTNQVIDTDMDVILNQDLGLLTDETSPAKKKRAFAVSCGIGLDAAVCKETNNSVIKDILNRFHLGKLSYVAIAVKQILSARQTSCDITLADQSCHHFEKVLFIVTMIQPYEGGGIKMAPMADGNDGLFDVMVVSNLHPLRAFYLLPMAFFGKHVNSRCVHFFKTESLTIHTKDAMTVHIDGEYAGELNQIQLNCKKNMLSFIC
ncbi:MAG: diacylglycerol/lipid kinase family protein [Lachnospiraceae bacterium]